MAFTSGESFVLRSGKSVRIWLTIASGADAGAQWIMADPTRDGVLTVTDFTKERRIEVPNRLLTIYHVTVTNSGAFDTAFTLHGGGNI